MPAPKLKGKQPRPKGLWQTFFIDGLTPAEYAFSRIMADRGVQLQFIGRNGTRFSLNTSTYRPDFFDPRQGIYYEVSGSRQAFHANKEKYAKFRKMYPDLPLMIVKPDGTEILC